MSDRAPPFIDIGNFRDYGGYAVTDGGRLRMGRFYRSAHHGEASPEDLVLLDKLGIGAIVDLRGETERTHSPSRRPENFTARIFEFEINNAGVPPHLAAAVKGVRTAEEARAITSAVYAQLPVQGQIIEAMRAYFSMLVDLDAPSVIHCAAGKDRTGIAVALLHIALGVHADDMMADYLLTNTIGNAEERKTAAIERIRNIWGNHLPEEVEHIFVSVEPDFLHSAFKAIEDKSGSIENYLRDELGADAHWREKARRLLIE